MRRLAFVSLILSLSATVLTAMDSVEVEKEGTVFRRPYTVSREKNEARGDITYKLRGKLSLGTVRYLSPNGILHTEGSVASSLPRCTTLALCLTSNQAQLRADSTFDILPVEPRVGTIQVHVYEDNRPISLQFRPEEGVDFALYHIVMLAGVEMLLDELFPAAMKSGSTQGPKTIRFTDERQALGMEAFLAKLAIDLAYEKVGPFRRFSGPSMSSRDVVYDLEVNEVSR